MPDIVGSLEEGGVPREVAPDWCRNVSFTWQKTISRVLGCAVNLQTQTSKSNIEPSSPSNLLMERYKGYIWFFAEQVDLDDNYNNCHGHYDDHTDQDVQVTKEDLPFFGLFVLLLLFLSLFIINLFSVFVVRSAALHVSVVQLC